MSEAIGSCSHCPIRHTAVFSAVHQTTAVDQDSGVKPRASTAIAGHAPLVKPVGKIGRGGQLRKP